MFVSGMMTTQQMKLFKLCVVTIAAVNLKHTQQTVISRADDENVTLSFSFVTSPNSSMHSSENESSINTTFVPDRSTAAGNSSVKFVCGNHSDITTTSSETSQSNCSVWIGSNISDTQTGIGEKRVEDYTEYKVYMFMLNYFVYITSVPGFITNPLCVITSLSVKPFFTSELFMLTLGITDFINVVFRLMVRQMDHYNVNQSLFVCKTTVYISNLCLVYSNVILVVWTIERFIAVAFPMKLASWCTMRNTSMALVILLLVIIGFNTGYLSEVEKSSHFDGEKTVYYCVYSDQYYKYFAHIESVYYIYIPILIICGCNCVILMKVRAMNKARIQMAGNQDVVDKRTKEQRQMTIILVTISACFVTLHIPMILCVMFGYLFDPLDLYYYNKHHYAQFAMFQFIGYSITEFQNSINFFLYCLTGTKFRSSFINMILCCRTKPKTINSVMTHTTDIKSMSENTSD